MKYLLDTNICIYIIKKKPVHVNERFRTLHIDDVGISTITLSELWHGVEKSAFPEKNQQALTQFLLLLTIVDYSQAAARAYGKIRHELQRAGTPIGPLDMLIAAHAKSLGVVLVTNNEQEFSRVTGLRIENWVE